VTQCWLNRDDRVLSKHSSLDVGVYFRRGSPFLWPFGAVFMLSRDSLGLARQCSRMAAWRRLDIFLGGG